MPRTVCVIVFWQPEFSIPVSACKEGALGMLIVEKQNTSLQHFCVVIATIKEMTSNDHTQQLVQLIILTHMQQTTSRYRLIRDHF